VVLVGEDQKAIQILEVRVEGLAQALLELVGPAADLAVGLDEGLDGEDVELHLVRVIHRRPGRWTVEVIGGDDDGLDLHPAQQALGFPGGEVPDGLAQDCASWSDHCEVAHSLAREIFNGRRDDEGLAHRGGKVDNCLEGWGLTLHFVVLCHCRRNRLDRPAVRVAQVQPSADGFQGILVNERESHLTAGAAATGCVGESAAAVSSRGCRYWARIEAGILRTEDPRLRSLRTSAA